MGAKSITKNTTTNAGNLLLQIIILLPWLSKFIFSRFVLGQESSNSWGAIVSALHLNSVFDGEYSYLGSLSFWLLLFGLSFPHILYYWVWTQPMQWKSFCDNYFKIEGSYVDKFSTAAHALKIWQFSLFGLYVYSYVGDFTSYAANIFGNMTLSVGLLALQLVSVGQILNVAVYNSIGHSGVYYGIRLGEPVPWVTGFPFSFISHSQYAGATLSIWGAGLIFAVGSADLVLNGGLYAILLGWSLFYLISSKVEQHL